MATYKEIKGITLQTLSEDPVEDKGTFSSGDLNSGKRSISRSRNTNCWLSSWRFYKSRLVIALTVEYMTELLGTEVNDLNAGIMLW